MRVGVWPLTQTGPPTASLLIAIASPTGRAHALIGRVEAAHISTMFVPRCKVDAFSCHQSRPPGPRAFVHQTRAHLRTAVKLLRHLDPKPFMIAGKFAGPIIAAAIISSFLGSLFEVEKDRRPRYPNARWACQRRTAGDALWRSRVCLAVFCAAGAEQ